MNPWKDGWTLRDHGIRGFCAGLCSILIVIAWSGYDRVLALQRNFDVFTYAGTVATVVGLIIAICEVLHGMKATRSIQHQAKSMLSQANLVDAASGIADCLAALDDTVMHINLEDYKYAWHCFLHFRKTCVRIFPRFSLGRSVDGLNTFGQIEALFSCALCDRRLSKGQKTVLVRMLLRVKQEIETSNPAGGKINAAA